MFQLSAKDDYLEGRGGGGGLPLGRKCKVLSLGRKNFWPGTINRLETAELAVFLGFRRGWERNGGSREWVSSRHSKCPKIIIQKRAPKWPES